MSKNIELSKHKYATVMVELEDSPDYTFFCTNEYYEKHKKYLEKKGNPTIKKISYDPSKLPDLDINFHIQKGFLHLNFKKNRYGRYVLTPKSLNPNEISELIAYSALLNHKIYTTRQDQKSETWIYQKGIFVPQGKSFIEEHTRYALEEKYNQTHLNKVLAKIKADTYIEEETFFTTTNHEEIPVQNGVLNLKTREIRPYNPEKDKFFSKLPVKYDEKTKCPAIHQHLKDVLKYETDTKVFYELAGYCLEQTHFIEKAFMLVGDGRNGKGKTLEILKRLVGAENCASIPLSSMKEDSFNLHQLHRKHINMAGDLNNTDLKNTGLFKSLTGRDLITAHRKFLSDLIFVNTAKNVFACNELPKVYDLSKGFWSRWILLEFPYQFLSEKEYNAIPEDKRENKKLMDPEHVTKILTPTELSGLLNKALDGLQKLRENKDFSYTRGSSEIKDFWVRRSNSFTAFTLQCLKENPNGQITKPVLRKKFAEFCKRHKLKGAGDKEIKACLEQEYGVVESQIRIDDEVIRVWKGIEYHPEPSEDEDYAK